jgi:quercetin 2,3-dioxygenase
MKTIYHEANSRGHADYGWLKTHYTFSFADYYNPTRIHFGALRVINDDWIAPDRGFDMHPHDNMEVITFMLNGKLKHEDSMGNSGVIAPGEIQIMSAGTGIFHSEFNPDNSIPSELLQIWVIPEIKNVNPRYDKVFLADKIVKNTINKLISPHNEGGEAWIYQQAWFYYGEFSAEHNEIYHLHDKNSGVYSFVIDGSFNINGNIVKKRDGLGIWETSEISITSNSDSKLLIIEVPMI